MTRQEKIREGIAGIIAKGRKDDCITADITERLTSYLDSEGAVLKVDRELPVLKHRFRGLDYNTGYAHCRQDVIEACLVAVEPLIEK